MSPQFFSDEEDPSPKETKPRADHTRKAAPRRGRELSAEEGNATVLELYPNQCAVRRDGVPGRSLHPYRMSTLAFDGKDRERSPVCVGDRVRIEVNAVVGRCVRRNRLVRSAPNSRDPLLHVIAANIDCLVAVAAAHDPEFSPGIVDRFLVAATSQGIAPVLCVNKTDLHAPGAAKPWGYYRTAGITVLETSARSSAGIPELHAFIRGRVTAFCGHSGVGKTSLLRRLLGDENYGRVGEMSAATGMGRHTTTSAVLLPGPEDSTWIDTPGIMNFTLVGVDKSGLLILFPELAAAALNCPAGCAHADEPACALRGLPRFPSYRQIGNSL
ncbi:MAG: ribosome small subunit-dependent GTPase A [Elusimicrobiota bacterium]|jgi:ribosome biogenesis GTPase